MTTIQTSFNAGEMTPRLAGRVDFEKYKSGLATCRNFVVMPHGGVERRPGFYYIAATKNSGAARLVGFVFSTTQAYVIEIGNEYMRFYKDSGQIVDGSAVEIATPYQSAHLSGLCIKQTADTMYISHPYYSPRSLTRTSHTVWLLTDISFSNRPTDWGAPTDAIESITLPSGSEVSIEATAHAVTTGDVLLFWGVVGTTELNGNTYTVTKVDADNFTLDDTDGDDFTAYTSGGGFDETNQPSVVAFHEQRSFWAGVPSKPQTIYGSVSGSPADMDTSAFTAGYGFEYTYASSQVNVMQWMQSADKLLFGTNGGEWWMAGSGSDDAITATNVKIRQYDAKGSQKISPEVMSGAVFFVERPGKNIRKYGFTGTEWYDEDLSVLAEHLTKNYAITAMAYQKSPWQIFWCVRSDGKLIALTYKPEHKVAGWHWHDTLGGTFDGVFESVAVIPGSAFDEVWVIVKRYVNGAWVRYVEQMQTSEWSYKFNHTIIDADYGGGVYAAIDNLLDSRRTWSVGTWPLYSGASMPGSYAGYVGHYKPGVTAYYMSYFVNLLCDVPAGATVSSATLALYAYANTSGTPMIYIRGLKGSFDIPPTDWGVHKWPAGVNDGGEALDALGWTTAKTSWSEVMVINAKSEIDVTDVINEVVNSDDYVQGKYIVIGLLDPAAAVNTENHYHRIKYPSQAPVTLTYFWNTASAWQTTAAKTVADSAFFVDSGLTYEEKTAIVGVTYTAGATDISLEATAHGLTTGDSVYLQELVGAYELNGNEYVVTVADADNFSLDDTDDTVLTTTYISGGHVWEGTTTVSGLDHLEGETVAVLGDGQVQATKTVVSGDVTLDTITYVAHIGLGYNSDLKPLRLSVEEEDDGTVQGEIKKVVKVKLRLYETTGGYIGRDEDNLDAIEYEDVDQPKGEMPPLYTGDIEANPDMGYEEDGQFLVRQSDPTPMSILAVMPDLEYY